ncbi:hypothetical protein LR002_01305, partial [Candidatus Gracilibacteria bacterium]|nr:hypothetical protein [Candidatus Gracilibacteria bacterium]
MKKILNIGKNFLLVGLMFFTFFSPVIENNFVGFGGENVVFASGTTADQNTSTNDNSKTKQSIVEIVMTVISGIVILTMWIINWVGYFLHPSTVFDPAILPTIKQFWLLFKNIILTASVFILIGIAIKNLFKMGSIGDLGKDVGKFILILVLINFSWFAVKFVIDIGNIASRAAFTLQDSLGSKTFWGKGYTMAGPVIVQWTGDGEENSEANNENFKYDICIKYVKDQSEYEELAKNGQSSGDKCDLGHDKIGESEAYVALSKNIIALKPIKGSGELGYDLPTAILWSFVPIAEFYRIGAGTKDIGTLAVETIFSLGTAIIMIISVLAMLVVFAQRLAYLWIYLVISPLYFFEKLLGLLNESWGKFIPDTFSISGLISQAIFVPVGFGLLYTTIAVLGGEFFYNNLLANGVASYMNTNITSVGSGMGSAFKLIIAIGIMVALWKGTQAVAKISGGIAETVVQKSTEFISGAAGTWLKDQALYSKTMMVGGTGKEGSKTA